MPVWTARTALSNTTTRAWSCVGLAALVCLFSSESLQNAIADGDTRTISFHHLHTGENITVTYKRNGRYDDEALKKINHEMRDWRRDEEVRMDPRVIDVIWEVNREVSGEQPIQIVCGYRAPATNSMLRRRSRGVAQFSQHTIGKAVDFYIPGVPLERLRIAGLRLQRGGVGFYPTSGSPFVHLDVGNVRHWPRLTHDQLARVFPNGRTVHIPSDGRPLSGYALALADVHKRGAQPSQMSLDAARSSGVATGEAPRRNLLASLFSSGGKDEDEDSETATTPTRSRVTRAGSVVAASVVPLPTARPAPRAPALASQTSTPFTLASAPPSQPAQSSSSDDADRLPANDVITARGHWDGPHKPAEPEQSAIVALARAALGRIHIEPRPADLETTGSVTEWPVASGEANDGSSPGFALAYAAQSDGLTATPVTLTAPMGSAVQRAATRTAAEPAKSAPSSNFTAIVKKPIARPVPADVAPRTAASATPTKQDFDDPWLRALMLAPNLNNYLTATWFDAPDPRRLRALMLKPDMSVMMTFSDDPHLGMTTERFTGTAVVFMSTVTFTRRTAMLQ